MLPVDWSAILGIRFEGRVPPSEPISSPEVRYLRDLLRREMDEPPTEL